MRLVTLRATSACTDDASTVGLSLLNWAIVLHVVGSVHVRVCTYMHFTHAPTRDHYRTSFTDVKPRGIRNIAT